MQRRIGECDPNCHISVAARPMSRAFVLTKLNCSERVGRLSQIITAAPQTLQIMARLGRCQPSRQGRSRLSSSASTIGTVLCSLQTTQRALHSARTMTRSSQDGDSMWPHS